MFIKLTTGQFKNMSKVIDFPFEHFQNALHQIYVKEDFVARAVKLIKGPLFCQRLNDTTKCPMFVTQHYKTITKIISGYLKDKVLEICSDVNDLDCWL